MSPELDSELVKKYPKIFRDRYGDMRQTLMCWGFDCGDGWYNILDALCSNIQHHIDWKREQRAQALRFNRRLKKAIELNSIEPLLINGRDNDFWVKSATEDLENKKFRDVPVKAHQVVAVQVKEKFGSLRFYTNAIDDTVRGMIRMAESMSVRTCEVCGNPGKSRGGRWIRTRCVHCHEE